MIQFARKTPAMSVLLFEKPDRMTRNFRDLVYIDELLVNHDKEIRFFRTGEVLNKNSQSSQKMHLNMQIVLARYYVDNLGEEVLKGMTEKIRAGGWPHRAPTGYRNNKTTKTIEIDPDTGPVVRRLFELYATGRYTLDGLLKVARQHGLRLSRGNLHTFLQKPIYAGTIQWGEYTVAGKHDPLISKAVFDAVQAHLHRQERRIIKHSSPFGQFATCSGCEASIIPEHHRKRFKNGTTRDYTYYRCSGSRTGGKPCPRTYISERDLEAQMELPLAQLQLRPDMIEIVQSAVRESFTSEREYQQELIERLQGEYGKLQSRIDQAYEDKLDGLITSDDYKMRASKWRFRQKEIEEELAQSRRADTEYLESATRIMELAQGAVETYRKADRWEKRKILDNIVSSAQVRDKRIHLNLQKPFNSWCKLAVAVNSGVPSSGWYP